LNQTADTTARPTFSTQSVESGPSVLQAGPQETGRTGIPDASMFCIAEARGFLPFFG